MQIKLAENSGFCFGVKRAINIAIKTGQNHTGKVVTLGPIIHNPQMVSKLKESGIDFVDDIDQITKDMTVIIRSHGITIEEYNNLKRKRAKIVDATCPMVKKVQNYAKEFTNKGYQLIIIGEKEHPEVKGIIGHVNNNAIVIQDEYEKINLANNKKLGVIAQTTQPIERFQKVIYRLVPLCEELHIINTICGATSIRQKATKSLAQDSDVMIIIGGKNSANTTNLADICRKLGTRTYHIETAKEIQKEWFVDVEKVGLSAGASTPQWIINQVYQKIKNIDNTENDNKALS